MLGIVLQLFNVTQLIDDTQRLGDLIKQQQMRCAGELERQQSKHLYYDPPIFISPEYFTEHKRFPPMFPSSYLEGQGYRLSFDLKRALYLQYLDISDKITNASFNNYLQEGYILENLKTVTAAVKLQKISKDIIIIDLGIKLRYEEIIAIFGPIVTPFDRLWLYNGESHNFEMTNLQDCLNGGFRGNPKPSLYLGEIDEIYDFVRSHSESQFEYYRNDVFISFFILFDKYSSNIIYGKVRGDYNLFFWHTGEMDKPATRHLSSLHSYFCKLQTSNTITRNRNSCVKQAVEIFAEYNFDDSVLLWVNDSKLVIGKAEYLNTHYLGFNYTYYNLYEFATNCVSDYLSMINIALSYQENHFVYVSNYNQNQVYFTKEQVVQPYTQLLPFPTRRMTFRSQTLSYVYTQIPFITEYSKYVGFFEKAIGRFVYQNVTGDYTVQVSIGDISSLYRRRSSPVFVPPDQFFENLEKLGSIVGESLFAAEYDELAVIQKMAASAKRGISPIEKNVPFETTDFSSFLYPDVQENKFNLGYYIPFLNDSFKLLRAFGNVDLFERDVWLSMEKLLSGDYDGAQRILNRFIRFTPLDTNRPDFGGTKTMCQKMEAVDYFIREYDEDSDFSDKLIMDDSLYISILASTYESYSPNEIASRQIFSPLLAEILFNSQAEILYTVREFACLRVKDPESYKSHILVNRNVMSTGDYYHRILLENTPAAPFYRLDLIEEFYRAMNLNIITVYDRALFTTEYIVLATKETCSLQNEPEYRILHTSDGATKHVILLPIQSTARLISGRGLPELVLLLDYPENMISALSINTSFMIFDSHAQTVSEPKFTGPQAPDLAGVYNDLFMKDLLLDDLLEIGFLVIYTANFTAAIQKGQIQVNESFDYSENNRYLSHIIANKTDPSMKCFGRQARNQYIITAEYFICLLRNSAEFVLGVNYFVPVVEYIASYKPRDFANVNYGFYNNVSQLFTQKDTALRHYYNFTYRSTNTRNIVKSFYNKRENEVQKSASINAEDVLIATFMLLAVAAFLISFASGYSFYSPEFLKFRPTDVKIGEQKENKFAGAPKIRVSHQAINAINMRANYCVIQRISNDKALLFASDIQNAITRNLLLEKLSNTNCGPFAAFYAHQKDRPNGIIYQANFVIQRNIFANTSYQEYYEREIVLQNEVFTIYYDAGPGSGRREIISSQSNQWKIARYEDFYDRYLRAPMSEEYTMYFGGFAQFTDLILLITR